MVRLVLCMLGLFILLLGSENHHAAIVEAQPVFSCADVTEIPQNHCEALVALYNSTDGENWSNNSGWLVTNTPCSWYGVVCWTAGQVSLLNMEDNRLTGNIPPEIGNLTSLQRIFFDRNQITGNIPSEIGNLFNLTDLALVRNQLEGTIPPELGNLTNLRQLFLQNNQLIGSIPAVFKNLISLRGLYLFDNQLTGTIPSELGSLPNLSGLFLSDNQLEGAIPPELGNLANLVVFGLSGNHFTGDIPSEIGNLTNLVSLYLDNNPLSGPLPMSLINLGNLDSFWFNNTDLCEPDDPHFQVWLDSISNLQSTNVVCNTPIPPDDFTLTVTSSSDQVWANGHETVLVTAKLTDVDGNGIRGRNIRLTANPPSDITVRARRGGKTNQVGEAVFEVMSKKIDKVTLVAEDLDDPTLFDEIQIDSIQRRVAVFVQGIATDLDKGNEHTIFETIRLRLMALGFVRPAHGTPETQEDCWGAGDEDGDGIPNDGCPLILNYSYNGGNVDVRTGIWKPARYACRQTQQAISRSILRLENMIGLFARRNPNTRFVIIGHSQGALIGLHALDLFSQRDDITIDAFISLDGALGGSPSFPSRVAQVLRCWGRPASTDMVNLWNSPQDHDRQGSTAQWEDKTNEEVVELAQDNGIFVATIGSIDDCVWDPRRCDIPSTDNSSTQIIDNANRSPLLPLGRNCRAIACISDSHSAVLTDPLVIDTIQEIVGLPTIP